MCSALAEPATVCVSGGARGFEQRMATTKAPFDTGKKWKQLGDIVQKKSRCV
jgi:hypothetical protein